MLWRKAACECEAEALGHSCVSLCHHSLLSAAFCIIVGQKFSGDCTVLIARSQLIYSSSKVTKKTLNILRKCEVSDFYRLLNCYIAAWEIAECNEKWHAQCKIFSWFVRWYITFLHCRYFIWILHCPFHKVLLFSNVNVNNVQWVADLQLQYWMDYHVL